ncbi:group II intron maturase-specific domain-containing protein [Rhizobium mesoamericanum]|uniref:group II intron maturase-specific domain-containing protein n=1 Tax=Rhizobium TaxID=379 RepID=UPI00399D73B7
MRKYNGKLLITTSKRSIKALLDKVRKIIKGNAAITQEGLIQITDPIIRGWAMYHRHVVAMATFSSVDFHIWRMLWRWACRRHSKKGARWIRRRYFRANGSQSWDFSTEDSKLASSVQRRSQSRAMPKSRRWRTRSIPHGIPISPAVRVRNIPPGSPVPHRGAGEWLEAGCGVIRPPGS